MEELITNDEHLNDAGALAVGWLGSIDVDRTRKGYRSSLDALGAMLRGECIDGSAKKRAECRMRREAAGLTDVDLSPWYLVAWHRLTPAFAASIRRAIVDRVEAGDWTPATANRYIAAVRSFLAFCAENGLFCEIEHMRITKRNGPFTTIPRDIFGDRRGRIVQAGERRAIMESTREDRAAGRPVGHRDAAALALLECGLRRSEVAGLTLADVAREASGFTLTVRGKGGRVRRVPMGNGHATALASWLHVRGDDPGPVLLRCAPTTGEITTTRRGISAQSIAAILRRHSADTGDGPACHDYRRTFVSTLLDAGASIRGAAGAVGHTDPRGTVVYDRREMDDLRDAMALMPSSYEP